MSHILELKEKIFKIKQKQIETHSQSGRKKWLTSFQDDNSDARKESTKLFCDILSKLELIGACSWTEGGIMSPLIADIPKLSDATKKALHKYGQDYYENYIGIEAAIICEMHEATLLIATEKTHSVDELHFIKGLVLNRYSLQQCAAGLSLREYFSDKFYSFIADNWQVQDNNGSKESDATPKKLAPKQHIEYRSKLDMNPTPAVSDSKARVVQDVILREKEPKKKIVDNWSDLYIYPPTAEGFIKYKVGEKGKIKSISRDTLGLTKGSWEILFVILTKKDVKKIRNYKTKSKEVLLSGLRKKLCEYFGPASSPISKKGERTAFQIKDEADVSGIRYQKKGNFRSNEMPDDEILAAQNEDARDTELQDDMNKKYGHYFESNRM